MHSRPKVIDNPAAIHQCSDKPELFPMYFGFNWHEKLTKIDSSFGYQLCSFVDKSVTRVDD